MGIIKKHHDVVLRFVALSDIANSRIGRFLGHKQPRPADSACRPGQNIYRCFTVSLNSQALALPNRSLRSSDNLSPIIVNHLM